MPLYSFACPEHGGFDEFFRMNDEKRAHCPLCHRAAPRQFTAFHHVEDRYAQFRNPSTGDRHSFMLGQDMPTSRREFHKLCEAKGIEPVSRASMPQSWRDAAQYAKHVREGGERVDPASVMPKEKIEGVTSIRDMVRANPEKFRNA